MKYFVVQDDSDNTKYAIIGAKGFTPISAIAEAPLDSNSNYVTDPAIIRVDTIQPTTTQQKQAVDVDGVLIWETLQRPTYDLMGNAILDGNGDPVMEDYQSRVIELDGNGDQVIETVPFGPSYEKAFVDTTLQSSRNTVLAQDARDMKLAKIRNVREPLLREVDIMVNELSLGDRSDTADIKTYRDDLKNLTTAYKDTNDATGRTALALIDSLNDDVSDLVLPVKP